MFLNIQNWVVESEFDSPPKAKMILIYVLLFKESSIFVNQNVANDALGVGLEVFGPIYSPKSLANFFQNLQKNCHFHFEDFTKVKFCFIKE